MAHVEQHPKAESGKREYSLGVPLSAFHARDRSLPKRVWYAYLHVICRLLAVGILRFRCRGREHLPRSGGALLLANHQSYFDPLIVGLTCDRPIAAIARKTLFRFPPFRWLIESLDAIPIDRGRPTLGEIKQILARLKRGQIILMFPEGTRTSDGRIGPLNAGFCSLARRAGVPIVVMAIDGAYDAWPKLR
ncbi:MAG TPA: lysophospholipid acyltransferase family protein, partial [Pirellulales bacterium]|nr:lysophospholipid acyltransferase family protein [Pirellulales bacterium]